MSDYETYTGSLAFPKQNCGVLRPSSLSFTENVGSESTRLASVFLEDLVYLNGFCSNFVRNGEILFWDISAGVLVQF